MAAFGLSPGTVLPPGGIGVEVAPTDDLRIILGIRRLSLHDLIDRSWLRAKNGRELLDAPDAVQFMYNLYHDPKHKRRVIELFALAEERARQAAAKAMDDLVKEMEVTVHIPE